MPQVGQSQVLSRPEPQGPGGESGRPSVWQMRKRRLTLLTSPDSIPLLPLSRGGSRGVGPLSRSLVQWLFGHRALAQVPAGGWTHRRRSRPQPAPGEAAPDGSPGARQSPSRTAAPVMTCASRRAASSSSMPSRPGRTSRVTGQMRVQGVGCPSHPCPRRGQRAGERQEAGLLPRSCRGPGPGFWG